MIIKKLKRNLNDNYINGKELIIMKKIVSTIAIICLLCVPALAQSFSFSISNWGTGHDSTSGSKTNTRSYATVSCNTNYVYWPSSGVVLRVRNASHNYATNAGTFSNGQSRNLSYLSGQNYKGTKWLYGSINDNKAEGYTFTVSGSWTP